MAQVNRSVRSRLPKIKKPRKKPLPLPTDALRMLEYLAQHYTFGRAADTAVSNLLKLAAQPTKQLDPLLNPPAFVVEGRRVFNLHDSLRINRSVKGMQRIELGFIDGHEVRLKRIDPPYASSQTRFTWGCRVYIDEANARRHWWGNVSQQSGRTRPHASQLLDYVAEICRYNNWRW